jgi:hypothetical protein
VAHFLNKDVKIATNSLKNLLIKLFFGKNIITIDIIPMYANAMASKSSL